MTGREETGSTARSGLVLLVLGALLLAAIIGWRVWGGDEEALADEELAALDPLEAMVLRTQQAPDDPEAWQELGYEYFQRQDYAKAAEAYGKAVERDPESAVLHAAFGEATVYADQRDPMPAAALAAFRKAAELDPKEPRARYFLAVKKDLDGNSRAAIADMLALLEDTPPGATWEQSLADTITQIGLINSIPTEARLAAAQEKRAAAFADASAPPSGMPGVPSLTAGQAIPGPTREQMENASQLPPGEQEAMVAQMVANREAKQRANPQDVDGWVLLMRSYMTLGRQQKAREALASAVAANPKEAARLRAEAELLGIN